MVSFEFLGIVLSMLGLSVSIIYYSNVLRNANISREAQLLNSIYQDINNKQKWSQIAEITNYEWSDYENFISKYGVKNNPDAYASWHSIMWTFGGIGHLLRGRMIDPKRAYNLIGPISIGLWEKFEPIIVGYRVNWKIPEMYATYEYLYREMKKLREEGYPNEMLQRFNINSD